MLLLVILLVAYIILCTFTFLVNLRYNLELLLDLLNCEVANCKHREALKTSLIYYITVIIFVLVLPVLYIWKGVYLC